MHGWIYLPISFYSLIIIFKWFNLDMWTEHAVVLAETCEQFLFVRQ